MAAFSNVEELPSGNHAVAFDKTVTAGWNLLPADMGDWEITEADADYLKSLKAYYVHVPLQNKYVNSKSGFSSEDFELVQANKKYMQSSAGWYYFSNPVTVGYEAKMDGEMPTLSRGWNLLSIEPKITQYNDAVSHFPYGDCQFEKFFMWNPGAAAWGAENIGMPTVEQGLNELAEPDGVGAGIAIKVTEECQLGIGSDSTDAPPTVPS